MLPSNELLPCIINSRVDSWLFQSPVTKGRAHDRGLNQFYGVAVQPVGVRKAGGVDCTPLSLMRESLCQPASCLCGSEK